MSIINENKNQIFLLLIFFISLLINLFFSEDLYLSLPRVLKFLLIIIFIITFKILQNNYDLEKNLFQFWVWIFLFVLFDIVFEILFGRNIIGNTALIPGRISSFTGDDMNIGNFFSAFVLIVLSFFNNKYRSKKLNFLLVFLFLVISFLIGERANFIKTFIMIIIFSYFILSFNKRYLLTTIILISFFLLIILNYNNNYKTRYISQLSSITKEGIGYYLENSIYGAHYSVAKEIFKKNIYFGVGIKNFRIASYDEKYVTNHKLNDRRANTHPHQLHYEFLAETGLFGYFFFLLFMFFSLTFALKQLRENLNLYQLSGLLFIVVNLIPLIPSGSFFATFSSGLFWINYTLLMGNYKIFKSNQSLN
ncbi:O-antigen ligase family protein [Candidatus Pelagibacter communis]|uniref:O-antigen ligase family protein n=1 Tax=Candidatus Pelagibacter TaxID=198251 RepID=UPI003F65E9AB